MLVTSLMDKELQHRATCQSDRVPLVLLLRLGLYIVTLQTDMRPLLMDYIGIMYSRGDVCLHGDT